MLFDLTRNKVLPHFHDLVTMSVLARTANIGFLNDLHMAKRRSFVPILAIPPHDNNVTHVSQVNQWPVLPSYNAWPANLFVDH